MASPPMPSLSLSEPLWVSTRRGFVERLDHESGLSGYSHDIQAFGGFWQASFSITGGLSRVEDWQDRIGWHVVCYGDGQAIAWEGFVNSVTVTAGPRQVTLGPLMDVCNRAALTYSTVDTSTIPPTVGLRATTATVNNTTSQGLYGIRNKMLSSGGMTATTSAAAVNRYIAERAYPKPSGALSPSGTSIGVKVECLGYVHLLDYPYNQTVTTGGIDLSDDDGTGKLQLIISADVNSLIPESWIRTADNTLQVGAYENDNKLALEIIKDLVARGDASYNRYIFGIYEDRIPVYEAAPTTEIAYFRRLSDPSGQITTPTGQPVRPWEVRPGRWLYYPDWNVGRTEPATRRQDSRFEFIESVSYTAPYDISTQGGDTDTLSQYLASLGISGIGG